MNVTRSLTFDDIALDARFALDAVRRPHGQDEGVQIVHLSVARNLEIGRGR